MPHRDPTAEGRGMTTAWDQRLPAGHPPPDGPRPGGTKPTVRTWIGAVAAAVSVVVAAASFGYAQVMRHEKAGADDATARSQEQVRTLQRDLAAARQQNDDL